MKNSSFNLIRQHKILNPCTRTGLVFFDIQELLRVCGFKKPEFQLLLPRRLWLSKHPFLHFFSSLAPDLSCEVKQLNDIISSLSFPKKI